jgi:hypothetical protein
MSKSETINCELVRLTRQITNACVEDLSQGTDQGAYIDRLVGKVQGLRQQLREAVEAEKPKPPKGYRPYTLQEAYDLFGWRSYTDIRRVVSVEDDLDWNKESDSEVCVPRFDYQIDGIVISRGVIHARIHKNMEDENYQYVSLSDLLTHWRWPGGKPCGKEEGETREICNCCHGAECPTHDLPR